MKKEIGFNRNLISAGIILSLFIGLIFLIKTNLFSGNGLLNLAITADLLLTVPLIWFLLIRKSNIPKTTIVPVMILGLLIGSYFLPENNQTYLAMFKTWVFPLIELSVLAYIFIKVRTLVKKFKAEKESVEDFYSALRSVCSEMFPKKIAAIIIAEVAVFYYGFINWKSVTVKSNEFTYHKNSGTPALLGALIFIIAIETLVLHILLERWSPVAAWILTGLSVYSGFQIFGIARALSKRLIVIVEQDLMLKYGILSEVKIPFSEIESVEVCSKEIQKDKLTKKLSPLGDLESHNILLRLNSEVALSGLYGIQKKFKVLAFYVDEPDIFKLKMDQALLKVY